MGNIRTLFIAAALAAVPALAINTASAQVAAKADNPLALTAAGGKIVGGGYVFSQSPNAADVAAMLASPGGTLAGTAGGSSYSANGKTIISGGLGSQAYGTHEYFPYTTKRASETTNNGPDLGANDPVGEYPWRATGKLWMYFSAATGESPAGWYMCTASLIKPGVLVTAAHCVFNYGHGSSGWVSQVYYYPANYQPNTIGSPAGAPYGVYRGRTWFIPTVYKNGTDTCTTYGVVCSNDLAVVVLWRNNDGLANNSENNAGVHTGWFGYGWNGPSFVYSNYLNNDIPTAEITQLGYPKAIDGGWKMIRTDSADTYYSTESGLKNQIWGSAQTGGSSGGPEIVNFGTNPIWGAGSSPGTLANQWVIGVTSWGYGDLTYKIQGASWFGQNNQFPNASYGGYGAGNIGALVNSVCSNATYSAAC